MSVSDIGNLSIHTQINIRWIIPLHQCQIYVQGGFCAKVRQHSKIKKKVKILF